MQRGFRAKEKRPIAPSDHRKDVGWRTEEGRGTLMQFAVHRLIEHEKDIVDQRSERAH